MANKFDEVMKELKKSTIGKKGKTVRSFSRGGIAKLGTALLNTPDHEVEIAKMKDGKVIFEKTYPVRDFRNYMADVAVDAYSVDKNEARGIMAKYEFKESDILYPISSELVSNYAIAKKFDFLPKRNFSGGLIIEEVPLTVSEYTAPSTKEKGKIEKGDHLKLKAKPKVPKWLKRKL